MSDGRIKDSEAAEIKSLGTLSIKCIHEIVTGTSQKTVEASGLFKTRESVGIVSEKALKGRAISHGVE